MTSLILASIGVFLGVILLLVIILLVAKGYLTPSGEVTITMNGEQELKTNPGGTLLGTLSANGVFLSSACGGKGSCGQCRCQVLEGGGEILPTETGFFSRKQQAAYLHQIMDIGNYIVNHIIQFNSNFLIELAVNQYLKTKG